MRRQSKRLRCRGQHHLFFGLQCPHPVDSLFREWSMSSRLLVSSVIAETRIAQTRTALMRGTTDMTVFILCGAERFIRLMWARAAVACTGELGRHLILESPLIHVRLLFH